MPLLSCPLFTCTVIFIMFVNMQLNQWSVMSLVLHTKAKLSLREEAQAQKPPTVAGLAIS